VVQVQNEVSTDDRKIVVYGNPDKTELGFPMPGDLDEYIKQDIFESENGRYRYTQMKDADIIVLSRDGDAFGYFEIEGKTTPTDDDRRKYPRVKSVYLVRSSFHFSNRVNLADLSIGSFRFGKAISEVQFQKILERAGQTDEYRKTVELPESPAELERVLRDVKNRLGQSEFRKKLMEAYDARCAITECDAAEALEAAHIDDYSGRHSNHPSNGLLLRADIHSLFDLGLIGIDPETGCVCLSSQLMGAAYEPLRGRRVVVPTDPRLRPKNQALHRKWNEKFKK